MRTVVRWIDRHDGATPLQILSRTVGDDATATDLLSGIVGTDAREQSGIWSTASGVLAAYRSESALASTELPPLDAAEFCRGTNTMYICSAGRRQDQFAPLVVAALGDVRDATYDRERSGERLPPTLLALDEVANIAPLPDLPALLSEGAGQGLLVMACLQDLSQARGRWGSAADGFLTLFGTTVVFPGIADVGTLRDLSALAGDREVATTTVGHAVGERGRVRPSSSVSTVRVPRLPVDVISRGTPGCALVLSPERSFGSVTLTPAHVSSPWRELTAAGRTHLGPGSGRAGPGGAEPGGAGSRPDRVPTRGADALAAPVHLVRAGRSPSQPPAGDVDLPGRLEMIDQAPGRQRGDPGGQDVLTEGVGPRGHPPSRPVAVDGTRGVAPHCVLNRIQRAWPERGEQMAARDHAAQGVTVLGHTYLRPIGRCRHPQPGQLIQSVLVRAIDGGGGEGGDHVPPTCRSIGRQ